MNCLEELKIKEIYNCPECNCNIGEDWEYKDFSNKCIAICPQCKTEVYLEDKLTKKELKELQEEYKLNEVSK